MIQWIGPHPPMSTFSLASEEEKQAVQERYTLFLKRTTEYKNYVYYWERWFMKLYRWWTIKVLGRDPKPYFDTRY